MKRDPASIAWAGGSAGGTDQLLVGLLAKAVGADPAKTKYVAHAGGGEAIAAILSGSVDAGVSGASEFADQVEAGKMRVLAVSGEEAVDVGGTQAPTIKEEGYDVVLTNWRGIVAPPGLSDAERQDVVAFVEKVRATPSWKESVDRFGWTEVAKPGTEFDSFLEERGAARQAARHGPGTGGVMTPHVSWRGPRIAGLALLALGRRGARRDHPDPERP